MSRAQTRPVAQPVYTLAEPANAGAGTILVAHLLRVQDLTDRARTLNARLADHLGFILGRDEPSESTPEYTPADSVMGNIDVARMQLADELGKLEDHVARLEEL